MRTTIKELFSEMGYDISTMQINVPIAVEGFKVRSYNEETRQQEMKQINYICKKELTEIYTVTVEDNKFQCAGEHKIAVSDDNNNITYAPVKVLYNKDIRTLDNKNVNIVKNNTVNYVYDVEVDGNHNYYSDGILSHNSLYGLDKDTVGGAAWKYATSLRVRLKKGKKIEQKLDLGKKIVGIAGSLIVEKSRLRAPFSTCNFNIYFTQGIDPLSGLFNVCKNEEVVEPFKKEDGTISRGWYTYKDVKFQEANFAEKVLAKYPELLGGHIMIEAPMNIEIEGGNEDDDDREDIIDDGDGDVSIEADM